jgi:hypothetical protein
MLDAEAGATPSSAFYENPYTMPPRSNFSHQPKSNTVAQEDLLDNPGRLYFFYIQDHTHKYSLSISLHTFYKKSGNPFPRQHPRPGFIGWPLRHAGVALDIPRCSLGSKRGTD